ncbi:MAG: Prophage lipoprotein Bor homolog [Arenicellales bacterium IbO2]|nr:MAG: Prophage lipoprotein Bor homolog [Arenicellales bacterium IbO2]
MSRMISIVFASLLVAGCAQTKFHMQERDDSLVANYDEAQHYFIYGLGQQKNLDPAAICGSAERVARVETQTTFVNGLVGAITFGIYTPRQTRIYCR